ncbi:hypothetical protein BHM03_00018249 [Ensete ventricosum]|nr:hypothetical protein BHM03_00018249 [Ensete ventricosum]
MRSECNLREHVDHRLEITWRRLTAAPDHDHVHCLPQVAVSRKRSVPPHDVCPLSEKLSGRRCTYVCMFSSNEVEALRIDPIDRVKITHSTPRGGGAPTTGSVGEAARDRSDGY